MAGQAEVVALNAAASLTDNPYVETEQAGRTAPGGEQDALSPAIQRSYDKVSRWSRWFLIAFYVVCAAFILWSMPWLPYSGPQFEYNDRVLYQTILTLAAALLAFGAVNLRERKKQVEKALLAWTSVRVHDGLTRLRQREYFYERVVIECQRAKADASSLAVVVIRLPPAESGDTDASLTQRAIESLEPMVTDYDCLAAISAHEIAVLVPRIDGSEVANVVARLQAAVGAEGGSAVDAGWAVYGEQSTDAGDLLGHARSAVLNREAGMAASPRQVDDAA